MIWNEHSRLKEKHAYLSPSSHAWVNYSDDKLIDSYLNHLAVERGTRLHALAEEHILLGIAMPDRKETLCMYVNDALYYKMRPEQVLYYSDNCFGTADTIWFGIDEEYSSTIPLLRIHDLKTGKTKASFSQLDIYAALFCLEYIFKPSEILIEERIYQNNKVRIERPDGSDILPVMDSIVSKDHIIDKIDKREKGEDSWMTHI